MPWIIEKSIDILLISQGFLSSAPSNETTCTYITDTNEDIESTTENNVFNDNSNNLTVSSQSKLSNPVSKACAQRRKSFSRSDAICGPNLDIYGSQKSIDVIDYVHNNKKEKITVIVNLLSDDMLLNQRHEKDSHSAGKVDQPNLNSNDNLQPFTGDNNTVTVKTEDNSASTVTEPNSLNKPKRSLIKTFSRKTLNGPNIVRINNDVSSKGKIIQKQSINNNSFDKLQ